LASRIPVKEDGLEAEGLCCNETTGLVYEGSIAGRQAKERFDAFQLYVFENFYSKAYLEFAVRMIPFRHSFIGLHRTPRCHS
jgi:hypothetical protein